MNSDTHIETRHQGAMTMARLGRTILPDYPHHIIQRGHNRQVVFAEARDYERYLATLAEFKDVYGIHRKGDRFIFPNRTRQEITVVGSRASGKAGPTSDYDYIMSGKSSQRHSAKGSVPRGTQGGEINSMGRETGIDVWQSYNANAPGYTTVSPNQPHITFYPK